jgi:ElaB/YqjD/DUF883 family membrane-anchored ribosome-binding protein
MFTSNLNAAGGEVRSLISEAERMLDAANATAGDATDELKQQSKRVLTASIAKARELEKMALDSGRAMAASTDTMVHENPWRAIAIAGVAGAGIGLMLGMAINSK